MCDRGIFTVTTTHMKFGYHRRNGVPASTLARMTEHYIRRDGTQLSLVQIVEDAAYLTEPLVRTQDFYLNPGQNVGGQGYGYEVADEIPGWPKGYIPSYPLGTQHTEFAVTLGVPFEATQGHAEAMYPEFLPKLRRLMAGASGAANEVGTPSPAPGARRLADPSTSEIEVIPVKGKVFMLVVGDMNLTAQVGDQGVLLVDAGPAEMSARILAVISQRFNKPVRYLVNTHAHSDHTGGNLNLSQASGGRLVGGAPATAAGGAGSPNLSGVIIASHVNALDRMNGLRPEDPPVTIDAWPTSSFLGERKKLFFNGEPIEILHLPAAHTDGDVLVFFRESDVISAGDVFTPDRYPVIDTRRGGTAQGFLAALHRILDMTITEVNQRGGTRVIGGHGRYGNEADVDDYRNWMTIVRDRVAALAKQGMTLEQAKAARPTLDFDAVFDHPASGREAFIEAIYRESR